MLDYARCFGLPAAVLRMSCIYGPHQLGTEDQGWVAHFLLAALGDQPITIYGDGQQVRDILYVDDAGRRPICCCSIACRELAGRAFNLGGGPRNAVSLLALLEQLGRLLGRPVEFEFADWRVGDQRYYVERHLAPSRRRPAGAPASAGSRAWPASALARARAGAADARRRALQRVPA